MAFAKTLLSLGVILFLMSFVLEVRQVQGTGLKNKDQAQNQTEMMELLKELQEKVEQLEAKEKICLRGRDGRDGIPGPPGAQGMTGNQGPKGQQGPSGPGGVVYTRWGRTACPSHSSVVYQGRTGGQYYTDTGGGSNYVCLTLSPRFGKYSDGLNNNGYIYGSEYETAYFNPFKQTNLHHNAPCVVCHVQTRSTKLMVPGTYACPSGWTREYWGYLMSEKHDHKHTTEYICVDKNVESVPSSSADNHGALLYPVEGRCGSLPCGPYVEGRELTCAVCTK